jgi:hypothetical protein
MASKVSNLSLDLDLSHHSCFNFPNTFEFIPTQLGDFPITCKLLSQLTPI